MLQKKLFELVGSVNKERKELKLEKGKLKDALDHNDDYCSLNLKLQELQKEKKNLVMQIAKEEGIDLEVITNDLKNDLTLISDSSLAILLDTGKMPEPVELDGDQYVPVVNIKYIKNNEQ